MRDRYQRHDKVNPSIRATLDVAGRRFTLLVKEQDDDPDRPSVVVSARPTTGIELTMVTGPELAAIKKFWIDAIECAEPIVASLDQEAAEAAANGDTSYKRLYRPDPHRIDY